MEGARAELSSTERALRGAELGWLGLYGLDALLSVLDELSHLATGQRLLAPLRNPLAGVVLLCSPLAWLAVGLSPRLRLRVHLPLLLLLAWITMGWAPLSIWTFGEPTFGLYPQLIQVVVAAVALVLARAQVPATVPALRWRRLGLWLAAHLLLVPLSLGSYTFLSARLLLDSLTGGYAELGLDGISVLHRRFERQEQTVDLIGMIHIGDESAYRQLFEPLPADQALVLSEGVSDEQDLLAIPMDYDPVARSLGLTPQAGISEMSGLTERNADVDVAEFSDQTVELLRSAMGLMHQEDKAQALRDYLEVARSHPDPQHLLRLLEQDLLHLRNSHLIAEVDAALPAHPHLVLPWGAAHLPELDEALRTRGFEPVEERWVVLIPF